MTATTTTTATTTRIPRVVVARPEWFANGEPVTRTVVPCDGGALCGHAVRGARQCVPWPHGSHRVARFLAPAKVTREATLRVRRSVHPGAVPQGSPMRRSVHRGALPPPGLGWPTDRVTWTRDAIADRRRTVAVTLSAFGRLTIPGVAGVHPHPHTVRGDGWRRWRSRRRATTRQGGVHTPGAAQPFNDDPHRATLPGAPAPGAHPLARILARRLDAIQHGAPMPDPGWREYRAEDLRHVYA